MRYYTDAENLILYRRFTIFKKNYEVRAKDLTDGEDFAEDSWSRFYFRRNAEKWVQQLNYYTYGNGLFAYYIHDLRDDA